MARGKEQRPAEILVDRIRARATDRIVVLVDGPACSGKTTLADEIAYALKAQLVHMDAFYPGWGGLEVGSSIVSSSLLAAESPGYHRWDWATGKQAEWHKVNPRKHLVIEGSGALSAENLALATYGVWIHLPLLERRELLHEHHAQVLPLAVPAEDLPLRLALAHRHDVHGERVGALDRVKVDQRGLVHLYEPARG